MFGKLKRMFMKEPSTVASRMYDRVNAMNAAEIDQLSRDLANAAVSTSGMNITNQIFDGNKFAGGYGSNNILTIDYWSLRTKSKEMFTANMYARGLIRRLVTNAINTGLSLEAIPEEKILGKKEDELSEWSEDVENRFHLWGSIKEVCDYFGKKVFSELQAEAYREALICGDVLVAIRINNQTKMPMVQLISGSKVQATYADLKQIPKGHYLKHGIEFNKQNREVAYHIITDDGKSERLPVVDSTGRRVAWLVSGCDRMMDDVRGVPLLSLILQSLVEIDRYRDAVQRKAVINSVLAFFIQKDQEKLGTLPTQGGAMRKGTITNTGSDGVPRSFNFAELMPGTVFDELQVGEKPVIFGDKNGSELSFGPFEEAMVHAIAWINEIPASIARMAFSSNYAASQGEINEFKIVLNRIRADFSEQFCKPIYRQWFTMAVMTQRILARGYVEALNRGDYEIYGAWLSSDWTGAIKPSADIVKHAKGQQILVQECWSTNDRAARETTGTKFSKNVKKVQRENQMKAEAMRPLLELEREFGSDKTESALAKLNDSLIDAVTESVEDSLFAQIPT